MNIAFPAIVLFLILLPGILCKYFYQKGDWTSPVAIGPIQNEIVSGTLFSLFLHAVFLFALSLFGQRIDYASLLHILSGKLPDDLQSIVDFPFRITWYFIGSSIIGAGIGFIAHKIVRFFYLDWRIDALKFKNEWFYLLRGEQSIIDSIKSEVNSVKSEKVSPFEYSREELRGVETGTVIVSAVVNQGSTCYLYTGTVQDFFFGLHGHLDRIVLVEASRRLLEADKEQQNDEQQYTEQQNDETRHTRGYNPARDPRYYSLDAEYLVLRAESITTLTVYTYRFESS